MSGIGRTIPNVSVIVSNNLSGFNYEETVNKFSEALDISLIKTEKRLNPYQHFRFVASNADCDYVTFLAIGDRVSLDFMVNSVALIDSGEIDAIIPGFDIIDKDGVNKKKSCIRTKSEDGHYLLEDYLRGPTGWGIYAMLRREVLVDLLEEEATDWFDYKLTRMLSEKYNVFVDCALIRYYRLEETSYQVKSFVPGHLDWMPILRDYYLASGRRVSLSFLRFILRVLKWRIRYAVQ